MAGSLHIVSEKIGEYAFAYHSRPVTLWSIERSLLVAHHHGDLEFVPCCKSRVLQHWLPIETVKSTEAARKQKAPGRLITGALWSSRYLGGLR
jgi:hypothetical protein